jgi:glucokinase
VNAGGWSLLADVGGTNVRFACATPGTAPHFLRAYNVSEFPFFNAALERYLHDLTEQGGPAGPPESACLAAAGPLQGDSLRLTNSPWHLQRAGLSGLLGGARVELINDFAAVGHGIAALQSNDWQQLGGAQGDAAAPRVVLGPGTGLGVCSLFFAAGRYQVVAGEGGHVDFAPVDERDCAVLEILRGRFGRVSVERVLSGAGILNVYQALAQLEDQPATLPTPAAVSSAALDGRDALAMASMQLFLGALGSHAGNLALQLGARGGVYIAGGILPRLRPLLADGLLRSRFEDKGRMRDYLTEIPLRLVLHQQPGLLGAWQYLLAGNGVTSKGDNQHEQGY